MCGSVRCTTVGERWVPSTAARLWGWAVRAVPDGVGHLLDPGRARSTDEDLFSAAEGGDWSWYPSAGSFAPVPRRTSWRLAGRGACVHGSLHRSGDQVRFVPNAYGRTRGTADWERRLVFEESQGSWRHLTFADGDTVVRRRRRSGRRP